MPLSSWASSTSSGCTRAAETPAGGASTSSFARIRRSPRRGPGLPPVAAALDRKEAMPGVQAHAGCRRECLDQGLHAVVEGKRIGAAGGAAAQQAMGEDAGGETARAAVERGQTRQGGGGRGEIRIGRERAGDEGLHRLVQHLSSQSPSDKLAHALVLVSTGGKERLGEQP